jgi:hypothetical protein
MAGNKNLQNANKAKKDEFYTQYADIETECMRYRDQFRGKVIYCNCDDPEESNFYKFFHNTFDFFGLKKLVTTHFEIDKASYKLEYSDGAETKTPLKQNFEQGENMSLFDDEPTRSYSGDFRSPECIEILKEADVVITNPPFSLFREYVAQLIEYRKKFLIIGNQNAITYKEIFKLIKDNEIWLGYDNGGTKWFQVPTDYDIATETRIKFENSTKYFSLGSVNWYTNLDTTKRHENLTLYKKFNPNEYPHYDNYDAINVNRNIDIPFNYDGAMGVPITFMDKYNPEQFEILGNLGSYAPDGYSLSSGIYINGRKIFKRILIKHKLTYDDSGNVIGAVQ